MGYHQAMTHITMPALNGFSTTSKINYSIIFPKPLAKVLATSQLGMGIAAVIFQVLLHCLIDSPYNALYFGYYCGPFFIIAGISGVCAAEIPGKRTIICFMIFSIFSSLMAIPLMFFAYVGRTTPLCSYDSNDFFDGYIRSYLCEQDINTKFVYRFLWCLIAVAIADAVVAIGSSVVCCKAVCCYAPSHQMTSHNNMVLQQSNGNQFTIPVEFSQEQSALTTYGQQPVGYPVGHQQQAYTIANIHSFMKEMEPPPTYAECSGRALLTEKE